MKITADEEHYRDVSSTEKEVRVNLMEQGADKEQAKENQRHNRMNPKTVYEQLSRCIPYAHLCLLEDILNDVEQPCKERDRQMLQELKDVVMYARSWSHLFSKTDRDI